MECLIKYVAEGCDVSHYEDFNEIDNYKSTRRIPKAGRWTYKDTSKTKEDYLKYYAVKTCAVRLNRTTIVLENDDNKISIKIYQYLNFRTVGVHYFRRQQTIQYITYNKKTKIVYVGQKHSKNSSIRSNPFQNAEINNFFSLL